MIAMQQISTYPGPHRSHHPRLTGALPPNCAPDWSGTPCSGCAPEKEAELAYVLPVLRIGRPNDTVGSTDILSRAPRVAPSPTTFQQGSHVLEGGETCHRNPQLDISVAHRTGHVGLPFQGSRPNSQGVPHRTVIATLF